MKSFCRRRGGPGGRLCRGRRGEFHVVRFHFGNGHSVVGTQLHFLVVDDDVVDIPGVVEGYRWRFRRREWRRDSDAAIVSKKYQCVIVIVVSFLLLDPFVDIGILPTQLFLQGHEGIVFRIGNGLWMRLQLNVCTTTS